MKPEEFEKWLDKLAEMYRKDYLTYPTWGAEKDSTADHCANDAFDKANPDQVGKPRTLYCPCKRCNPFCMSV